MKGLLLKDFYMVKKYCRAIFVCTFIFLAVSMAGSRNIFFAFYPVIITSMIPVTLIGYDERSRWDTYCGVMPYSRSQIVSGKYLVGLILLGAVWVLTAISQVTAAVSGGNPWRDSAVWLFSLLAMGLLSEGIILPVIFKYGVEKGRLAYYLIIVVFFAAGGGMTVLIDENRIAWDGGLAAAGLLAAAVVVFAVSWKLSIGIYEKKEL